MYVSLDGSNHELPDETIVGGEGAFQQMCSLCEATRFGDAEWLPRATVRLWAGKSNKPKDQRRNMDNSDKASTTAVRANHQGTSWNAVEQKIRELARAAVGELTNEDARRLYHLELSASRHSGKSPDRLLERARNVVR